MTTNTTIIQIRTGDGDDGETKLGGKVYRKGHPVFRYNAALDVAQSFSSALAVKWGDYAPASIMQELLFRLELALDSRQPKDQELALQELGLFMAGQIEYISGGLEPLTTTSIRCTASNYQLYQFKAALREAEVLCVAARDHIELEGKDTAEQMIYMLEKASKALNIASDWVFAFLWVFSLGEDGKVPLKTRWAPWTEDKIRKLNL